MSVATTLKIIVYGDNHEDILGHAQERIADFFQVDVDDVNKKFSYEIHIIENIDMNSDNDFEATVTVRGRDV